LKGYGNLGPGKKCRMLTKIGSRVIREKNSGGRRSSDMRSRDNAASQDELALWVKR